MRRALTALAVAVLVALVLLTLVVFMRAAP